MYLSAIYIKKIHDTVHVKRNRQTKQEEKRSREQRRNTEQEFSTVIRQKMQNTEA